MVYDDPAGLDGVFTPDITANDLRAYTGNGNPLCYISSVTYGRVFYVLYRSTATRSALEAALNFAYNRFGIDAGVQARLDVSKTLDETFVQVFHLGGDAGSSFTNAMARNLGAIEEFIERGANFSPQNPGAPISYTVKYLQDARFVRMNNTMDFKVERRTPVATERVCQEPPQVSTTPVEETTVTARTATVGGNVTFEGTPAYAERGVIYGTEPSLTLENGAKIPISGDGTAGSFSGVIRDLTPNTRYWVRAYAINEVGTAYGQPVDFTTTEAKPVLRIDPVSNLGATSVTLNGNITDAGAPAYTERGFVFHTSSNPTIDNQRRVASGSGATGEFSVNVTGLDANSRYYARAYAIHGGVPVYSDNDVEFTTGTELSFSVRAATNVTHNSATLNGNIANVGTPSYTERGFVYHTEPNPTVSNQKSVATGSGTTGNFSANVTSLTANRTYYVRAYVLHNGSAVYSDNEVEFQTTLIVPTFTTLEATNVLPTTATLRMNITGAGTPAYTERGVVWATTQNPTINHNRRSQQFSGTGTGNFTFDVTGLEPNTTYYVRAYVLHNGAPIYAQQALFTTPSRFREYIDANGLPQLVPSSFTDQQIVNYTNQETLGTGGVRTWVRVNGTRDVHHRITIQGDVHFILEDHSRLNAYAGINVTGNHSLTIYAQSTNDNIRGKLVATGGSGNAGIGGNAGQSGGAITINGGNIAATGGSGTRGTNYTDSGSANGTGGTGGTGGGAGIGGGGGNGGSGGTRDNTNWQTGSTGGGGGTIEINGGTIEATGGARSENGTNAAAGGGGGAGAGIGGGGGGGGGGASWRCLLPYAQSDHGVAGSSESAAIGNGVSGGRGGKMCNTNGADGGSGGSVGTILPANLNNWVTESRNGFVRIVRR